jgi:hypothetical protein
MTNDRLPEAEAAEADLPKRPPYAGTRNELLRDLHRMWHLGPRAGAYNHWFRERIAGLIHEAIEGLEADGRQGSPEWEELRRAFRDDDDELMKPTTLKPPRCEFSKRLGND